MNNYFERKMVTLLTLRYLRRFMKTYYTAQKDPSFWIKEQQRNIRKYIDHVYAIPFYRERFDRVGAVPSDIVTAEDFVKLPQLTRDEYRDWVTYEVKTHPEKYKHWMTCSTSGSSGTPLAFLQRPQTRAADTANLFRSILIQKKNYNIFFDSFFTVVSKPGIRKNQNSFIQRLGIARQMEVSGGDRIETLTECFNSFKPGFMYGIKSVFVRMIEYARKNNIPLHRPKLVATIGEMLDDDAAELLQEVFGKDRVYDFYGASETGNLCTTLTGGSLKTGERHYIIWHDAYVCNLINAQGKLDIEGNLVVTPLLHYGFPLLNYYLSDEIQMGIEGGVKYIKQIKGRDNDKVFNSDGTYYTYSTVYQLMSKLEDIRQYRLVQEDYDDLTICIARAEDSTRSDDEIRQILAERAKKQFYMGPKRIKVEFVDNISPDPSGKIRMIISKVKPANNK